MKKNIFLLSLVCCFFAALCPMGAGASGQPAGDDMIKSLIASLRLELQSAGQAGGGIGLLTAETDQLLDNLSGALESGNAEGIHTAVSNYSQKITLLQDEPLNPLCTFPLLTSMLGNISTMLGVVAADGDPLCLVINLTNSAADIISDIQTYNICVIDNSETPDNATRRQIVQQQTVVNTYSFITSALDIFLCSAAISPSDFVTLFFEFLAIFPKPASSAAAY